MKTDLHWDRIGKGPHHGICLPLSAIRTEKSGGIGEFPDLIPLIDWCRNIGFNCIQLLPLSDTGSDPSPYNPVSSSALDPIYLSLKELGIDDSSLAPFTHSDKIVRSPILSLKLELLLPFFHRTFKDISKTAPYQNFVLDQKKWLEPYAKFKAMKEKFEEKPWTEWPSQGNPESERIDFYTFLQFHAFRQMGQVRTHAADRKVWIKGDIPILLSPDSADVWASPSLFIQTLSAGAPPDAYNPLGQNWGFPLFDWKAMEQDRFQWWKQRLKTAETLYHIYRLDHVVGFFRIWGTERGKKGAEGSFFPPDPALWEEEGRHRLEMMIEATSMLPMGEDLGTIPPEVYRVLKELGICGTKVIRWQKEDGKYIPFEEYEPFSLTTLSTPDMEPLELWWKKYPAESVPFAAFMNWSYHPILTQKQRLKILQRAHHTSSRFHINLLQEYLALFPELVWPNSEQERINVPGTLYPSNWTYRFRPSLEEIIAHKGLRNALSTLGIGGTQ